MQPKFKIFYCKTKPAVANHRSLEDPGIPPPQREKTPALGVHSLLKWGSIIRATISMFLTLGQGNHQEARGKTAHSADK